MGLHEAARKKIVSGSGKLKPLPDPDPWDIVAAVIGMTGWTMDTIQQLTLPFLMELLRREKRVMWPQQRPALEKAFGQISDEPGKNGEPSEIDKIIHRHQDAAKGVSYILTAKERKRQYAYRIYFKDQLGDPDADLHGDDPLEEPGEPIIGLSVEAAEGVLAWLEAGLCPDHAWAEEFMHVLPHLRATAMGEP